MNRNHKSFGLAYEFRQPCLRPSRNRSIGSELRTLSMQRIQFITYESKQILFVDMTNSTPAEAIPISVEVEALVTDQPKNSVLILVDMTGAQFDKQALDRMKTAAAYDRPYVKRSAMFGVGKEHTAMKEALKIFSRREYRYFDTREEALAWLVG